MIELERICQVHEELKRSETLISEIIGRPIRLKIQEVGINRISIANIINIVATETGILAELITGSSRIPHIVDARDITIRLIKDNYPKMSTPQMGKYFNNRDHSSILAAYQRFTEKCEVSPPYRQRYLHLSMMVSVEIEKMVLQDAK